MKSDLSAPAHFAVFGEKRRKRMVAVATKAILLITQGKV